MRNYVLPILAILVAMSCKKRVEIREVPVEKITSWTESKRYTGSQRIMLSSGSDANTIYLQHPYFFSQISSLNLNDMIVSAALLPNDIAIKIPISPDFFANPFSDTLLIIRNNRFPIASPSGGFFNLKQMDPSVIRIQRNFGEFFKCMAINNNKTLLVSYENNLPAKPYTFFLFNIAVLNTYPYIDTVYTKRVSIPRTGFNYPRYMAAVKDYFLVDIPSEGIYKIRQDGSFSKVNASATVDVFYEWKNRVYGHVEQNKLLVSDNNAESFQEFTGLPFELTLARYSVIKDSLVGTYRDNLFTLKWSGNNYSYRFIKNDGLESTTINGLEILRDTVYVATTAGLYTKPVSSFFDSRQ
jgi:hypothetical protein